MKKSFKRILSTLLVLSIMLSLFAVHASAATVSESEPNNEYATANKITLGNTIKGTIGNGNDVDYFKVQTSSNGKVSLNFCHTYENRSDAWAICAYEYKDGKYTELIDYTIGLSGGENISLPSIGVAASTVYYIKITSRYGNNKPIGKEYQLVTSFTSTNYYEQEMNNEYATATLVSLGNTYGGNINKSGDIDYYKIVSSSNGKVSLNFKHTYENGSSAWTICVYEYKNGKYTEFTNYTIGLSGGENISLPSIGVVASTVYYIKIMSRYGNSIPIGKEYQLVTSFTSTNYYEQEMNNEYATATPVSLGNTYGGNLNKSDDNDYYKITATKNEEIKLQFKHTYENNSRGWVVYTYVYKDGKYSELSKTTIKTNDAESVSLPSIGASASVVYYVRVVNWSGNSDAVGREYTISFGGTGGGSGNNPTPVEPTGSGFFANLANLINEWANSDNILLRILGIILKVILPFI